MDKRYTILCILVALFISSGAFAHENGSELAQTDAQADETPVATVVVEASGGAHLMATDLGASWSVSAMARFGRLLVPLEVGLRFDGIRHDDKNLFALSIPVRIRHDWMFAPACSWDFHYGIELNIQNLTDKPFASAGFWIGTGFNYHFTSRQALGIGISIGHMGFERTDNVCHYETPCRGIQTLRADLRYTF